MREPRLRAVTLLREQIRDDSAYPFTVASLRGFDRLEFTSNITFFVGENGSGKSTLLEAIALAAGFGAEGGTQNFTARTTDRASSAKPLADALRLSWTRRLRKGFFLRAESLFNVASQIDELQMAHSYGGQSLHDQSHGESFFALVQHRFELGGLYLLDEPEAALSAQRQLSMLAAMHFMVHDDPDTQFIVATHSPILLRVPGAQIVGFDGDALTELTWEQTSAVQTYRSFLKDPDWWLKRLLAREE